MERIAKTSLAELGWTFVRLERSDWFVPDAGEAARLARGVEALDSRDVAFGETHEWVDGPETIDPEETETLQDALEGEQLVYASTDGKDVCGYVVGFSDAIVLCHHVDLDLMCLNGYCAISRPTFFRLMSVEERFELDEGQTHFAAAGLQALGVEPTNPGAPLGSWEELLSWAGPLGPIAIVERGQVQRGIGTVVSVDSAAVVLDGISAEGLSVGEFEHAIEDIAHVEFLDGYLRALERVAGPGK